MSPDRRPTMNRRLPRSLRRAVVTACGLLSVACSNVVTLDEVITESAAMRDDRLIGEWRDSEGKDRVRIARGLNNDYRLTYVDKEDSAEMTFRVGRVGGALVIDVYPDMAMWSARKESGLPTHLVFAIEVFGDSVALRGLEGDSVQARFASGPMRVPYSKINGDLVLHGDPSAVRAVLGQLFQQPSLGWQVVYRRVRSAAPPQDH